MNSFSEFHFLRPFWLLALIPLVVLLWLMIKKKLGSHSWETVCDEALLPYILIGSSVRKRRLSVTLTAIGGLLAIMALAGPVWQKLPQPVFSRSNALVIAFDLSRSMDANDISPSRLLRARYKIADILKRRTDGQTALLVYAGDSFTVTPLTDDNDTIDSQLAALSTDIMPVQGSNTLLALKRAEELLKHAGAKQGDILFISDDIDYQQAGNYVTALHDQGYRISVLGVGTTHGVPIPLADGSFLKDTSGKIVIPTLEEKPMRLFTRDGGGVYQRIALDDKDIDSLLDFFASHGREGDVSATELKTDTWREEGPWLLLILLPLMMILFRRGYLVMLLVFLMPIPNESKAMDWNSLWSRPDQQAARALAEGDAARAAKLFHDPAWKGTAQYRSGDFNGAIDSLKQTEDVESLYNMGNALARSGNYQEAISVYDKVLKRDPDHEDAKFNKKLLEKELEKQQQNQQQQTSNSGKDENKDQQDQQQDQQQGKQQQADNQEQNQDQKQNQTQSQDNSRSESEQAQQDESEQQQDRQQQQQSQQPQQQDQQQQMAKTDLTTPDEDQQALEQWLRRIPDDPAGLLRRKFRYQYQQRDNNIQPSDKTW